ncbi:glycoside hydrolase family 3 protein [Solwaraspora sp. WMMA2080]|uniref:glycoside hydrolase family 3 N-terminal domain-containing protein n=1 Tax=unclassified Solwaraspora TaxID=2627926 RepID=UPI00248ADBEE|nr:MULTISPECIES: glycoside hydrolase family 3 N-terminal domain-containing protein [unclassified Solwaraspora]WBB98364.1 glycoside hydrolase family 3 protein [Solwaraspora sp. WMMA2059]WBC23083.1 glycoside hydrolase family 3 protein [Solwaraspora sp. WMMA2080]
MPNDQALRRLALRTLLAAYPGTTVPQWAVDLVGDGLAGHTLFGGNVDRPGQLRAATDALRAARADVLVAIDEEGGDVTRLAHATGSPYPGNAALGAVDDPALTRQVYRAIGDELATCGANLDLAPTVDVNTADDNPIIGTRSFGADPALVATHAAAAVAGLADAGVAGCAKHFPGHGATVTDSHLELPTVDVPMAVLRRRDLPPFAAVVEAGTPAIMTAHIRVPALTGDAPATFSRAALTGLLRDEYGFVGVIVTDALEMRGATLAAGGIVPAAVAALAAGADLLCIGARVDHALVERVAAGIVAAIGDGTLPVGRVEQAADRVTALAAVVRPAADGTAGPADLGYAAARRAVRVEGTLDGLADALVVQLTAGSTIAEGRVPWGLGPHLGHARQLRVAPAEVTAEQVATAADGRPLVLVGRHLHRVPGAGDLIERLAARHPVAVVEMGWPSAWRPAGVRAFVTTYGASHANGRAAAEALGLAA